MKAFPKTAHKILTVTIDEEGNLIYLKTDAADVLLELGETVTKRASHVEPGPKYERWLFHTLRFLFGDKGRVSDWTRTWQTLWRVNTAPVGGPILTWKHVRPIAEGVPGLRDRTYYWSDRQAAIDAEIKFLNEWFLTR